jgi:plastocyanin
MTQLIIRHKHKFLTAVMLACVAALVLIKVNSSSGGSEEPRTIVLGAREIAFYIDGQPEQANPDLRLKAGQPVNLVIRNDEPEKVLHCFIIGGLNVKTHTNLETGQSETLTFTPDDSGTFTYACLMHPAMAGRVIVE